jgi:hypothetical protein
MARSAGLKRKQAVRVAEQGWNAMYYSFIWGVGMVRLADIMPFEVVVTDTCFVAVSLEEFLLLG